MSAVASAAFDALGTTAAVYVTRPDMLGDARHVLEQQLDELDRACSRFRDDSELARVNAAEGRPVEVSTLLLETVAAALRAAALTEGDVDPTVGNALRAIGYDRDFSLVGQTNATITLARAAGWRRVELDRAQSAIRVPAGVSLDLGATAKAFGADRAAHAIGEAVGGGVLVNLGGDVATAGDPPPGGWRVRVTDDHRAAPDAPGQSVAISSGGLATSSVTVRDWLRAGQRMHHIVDPRTGAPAPVVWRTVSVAAASCLDANTASTAAMLRGEEAPRWLDSLALPSRLVRPDGHVVRVAGWPDLSP